MYAECLWSDGGVWGGIIADHDLDQLAAIAALPCRAAIGVDATEPDLGDGRGAGTVGGAAVDAWGCGHGRAGDGARTECAARRRYLFCRGGGMGDVD